MEKPRRDTGPGRRDTALRPAGRRGTGLRTHITQGSAASRVSLFRHTSGVARRAEPKAREARPCRRYPVIVFFTVSTSCFRLKGFGRKLKASPSGRFLRKASSA
ncbi:hypothetical protein GCM10007886_19930 [Methylobacterium gregans]|nr:hypothetical protein GCM10007886_19930 [Methylobacterium gregans]